MPTIIGSTTVSVKNAAIAASMALPPVEASGWSVTTMPRVPVAGCFSQRTAVPAPVRQSVPGIAGAFMR
jgi:hypothetical protein